MSSSNSVYMSICTSIENVATKMKKILYINIKVSQVGQFFN